MILATKLVTTCKKVGKGKTKGISNPVAVTAYRCNCSCMIHNPQLSICRFLSHLFHIALNFVQAQN